MGATTQVTVNSLAVALSRVEVTRGSGRAHRIAVTRLTAPAAEHRLSVAAEHRLSVTAEHRLSVASRQIKLHSLKLHRGRKL